MCSGRVDLAFVLRAFLNGADGVFIGGCHLGECNYVTHGNYHALNMVLLCKRILAYVGLNPDRLRIEFMSAGDGILLAEINTDFSKQIKALGPLGKGEGEDVDPGELKSRLEQVGKLIPYIKIAKKEQLDSHLEKEEEYDGLFTREEIDRLFNEVVSYYIDPEKCKACMICARSCPVDAIDGGKNKIHIVDQNKCIKCGTCFEACPPKFGAVTQISREPVPDPIPEEKRMIKKAKKK